MHNSKHSLESIELYATDLCSSEPMEAAACANAAEILVEDRHMLLGRPVGSLLRCLVAIRKPKTIFEVGTLTGYSAAMMADAAPSDSIIYTTEENPRNAEVASRLFSEHKRLNRICLIKQEGFAWLSSQTELKIDFAFLDGRKESYLTNYNLVVDKLSEGGILVIDNSFSKGGVLQPKRPWEKSMAKFSLTLRNDARMLVCVLAVKDGVTVAIKRSL